MGLGQGHRGSTGHAHEPGSIVFGQIAAVLNGRTQQVCVFQIEAGINYFNHLNRFAQRNGLTPDEYWNEAI